MTHNIAKYVGSHFEDAGKFHIGMIELSLPKLVPPTPPTDTTKTIQMDEWMIANCIHQDAVRICKQNNDHMYAVILEQCAHTLQNCVKHTSNG